MKRKNPRLCKVVTIIPSSDKLDIVSEFNSRISSLVSELSSESECLKHSLYFIKEGIANNYSKMSLLVEKVLWVSLSSLVVSFITLILSFYV